MISKGTLVINGGGGGMSGGVPFTKNQKEKFAGVPSY
jgi:hypothetical protein